MKSLVERRMIVCHYPHGLGMLELSSWLEIYETKNATNNQSDFPP